MCSYFIPNALLLLSDFSLFECLNLAMIIAFKMPSVKQKCHVYEHYFLLLSAIWSKILTIYKCIMLTVE